MKYLESCLQNQFGQGQVLSKKYQACDWIKPSVDNRGCWVNLKQSYQQFAEFKACRLPPPGLIHWFYLLVPSLKKKKGILQQQVDLILGEKEEHSPEDRNSLCYKDQFLKSELYSQINLPRIYSTVISSVQLFPNK